MVAAGAINVSFEPEEEHHHTRELSKDADLKHFQEHYDEITDTKLPENLHRGDITTVNRFLGYHDAMMATCGTFLVLPLRNLNNFVKTEIYDELEKNHELPHDPVVVDDLAEYIDATKTKLIMFFLGFLIICTIWETNIIRTNVIKRYDDFMVMLGLFQMAAIVVLPFSIALNGAYPREDVTVLLTITILIIINIFELIMILYGFYCPRLLNMAMKDWSNKEVRRFMLRMCIKPIVEIVLVGVAGAFSLLRYEISWVLLALLIAVPLFRRLAFYYERHHHSNAKVEKCRFYYFFTKGQISKERVEAFSDAAIAIIACVLILDITVEEFPTAHDVKEKGLISVLSHLRIEIGAFFGTYLAVSLLWYVNHTVLHLFHTIDIGALYLQKIFLAFLCLAPIQNNMMVKTANKGSDAEKQLALQWSSGTVFAASFSQVLMVAWGFYRKGKLFHRWATCESTFDTLMNRKQSMYIRFKVAAIPFWSFIGIFSSFASGDIGFIITIVCIISTILSLILLKFIFMNHLSKKDKFLTNGKTISRDQSIESLGDIELRNSMAEEIADGKMYEDENEMEREVMEDAEKKN
ncbi:endosomal/lysosomal proton channel TMEM175-like [Clytia hemisphaerica]|uniref:endosomal/lysosomal proton channel TMEM175-like n=1 Tax=Clytia hemisphaerica TaxID=252671 RepID=UPI0034D4CC35